MMKNLLIRWILICAVLTYAFFKIAPTYKLFTQFKNIDTLTPSEELEYKVLKESSLKLGRDLIGGASILLAVDQTQYLINKVDSDKKEQFQNDVVAFLKNNDEENLFQRILDNSNTQLRDYMKNFIINENIKSQDNIDIISRLKELIALDRDANETIYNERLKGASGLDDLEIVGLGKDKDRIKISIPGISNDELEDILLLINKPANFEMALVASSDLKAQVLLNLGKINPEFSSLLQSGGLIKSVDLDRVKGILGAKEVKQYLNDEHIKFAWGKETLNNKSSIIPFYILEYESNYDYMPIVGSGDISQASAGIGDIPGEQHYLKDIVNLELKTEAQEKWCIFTTQHPQDQVAIVLDNIVYMAPNINEPICGGGILVTGFENKYESNEIAGILQAGQLAAPMEELQSTFIGPSIGQQSIENGSNAMAGGLLLVLIFMIIYYGIRKPGTRLAGLIACIALVLNIIIILAILIDIQAVLTFPGIAGLLLTVGMAVDANVIVFERIKEEIETKKINNSFLKALNVGYNKAFVAILDANITTIIIAIILFALGTDSVKGFGTTLGIGILASMFTGVFITKTIFLTYIHLTDK